MLTGLKDEDFGLNPSLLWLRDADRGLPSLNFQGIGVGPWMQPRLDPSMVNFQSDTYQAMAAAALQDMRALDHSKQHHASLLQFQQPQNIPNQMFQQSQPQQAFPNNQENQHRSPSQAQSQTHFQNHLQHQHSFNDQLQQQLQQQQQVLDHQQISSSVSTMSQFVSAPQSQSQPVQAISSLGHQQCYSDSNGNPVTTTVVSPLHSILGSFPQDETSHLLNLPTRTNSWVPVQPSTASWPSKRVAMDPLLSSGASQCITLPPFPGRECTIEGSADPQNLLFGVNIEPSSLLMHNGMSSLKGISSNSGSSTIPFQSSRYLNTTGNDSSLNPGLTQSIGESGFLQAPENGDQGNSPTRTFVKVSFSLLNQHFNIVLHNKVVGLLESSISL